MKLGYMARNQHGDTVHLTDPHKHPRGQLMDKFSVKHAERIYCDFTDGPKPVGYIVAGLWWEIYEVHSWDSKA
jgi:hypothetical protein